MLGKLLLALAFIYPEILNSSAMVTDDYSELESNIPQFLKMLYRAPEISLGDTIGHLFLEMTVTQQHYHSKFAVVNPDEIGAFFQNYRLSNDMIANLAALKLKPLYYEYVHVDTNQVENILTDQGWQVRYCYAAIIDDMPITIKLSPKREYLETIRKSKSLVNLQRTTLKDAFSQLKQSAKTISPGAQRDHAKEFLTRIKALTEKTLLQLKEMSGDWLD